MIKKIHMYIAYHTNEERNFIYGYKDKLLSLHKDKDYNGLDVECIEGSPVIDEICRYGKEHHIIQIKERRIDYTEDELERIPYFTLGIKGLNVPDNTLDAGVKYSYKCKSCCSGAVQKNSIELSIKRLLDYDVFLIEPELFISNRVREAFEKADITGCEYLDVIDKRTKKPTKEIFQIKKSVEE